MNDIILSTQNGEPVVSSRQIAENFDKNHRDVLRAVDNLKEDVRNFAQMFFEGTDQDSYGREQRAYLMNRDGFTLLAMGFTGKAALEWKLKYIAAFNEMEKKLAEPEPALCAWCKKPMVRKFWSQKYHPECAADANKALTKKYKAKKQKELNALKASGEFKITWDVQEPERARPQKHEPPSIPCAR